MTDQFKFADIVIDAEFLGAYLQKQCASYRVTPKRDADFSVCVTQEDLDAERAFDPNIVLSDSSYESLAFYRRFCEQASLYDCMLFHSSAIAIDGKGYLFAAPSGTGKSTHTRLYREVFGRRVTMINDDKPLVRKKKDGIYVYGTPWTGKHHLGTPTSVPVSGICFLKQAETNAIRRLSQSEALILSLYQVYRPKNEEGLLRVMKLLQELIAKVPIYELQCTISKDAVRMSYEALVK